MSTAPKQAVLDYLYRQAKRGKLTQDEYDFIKLKINKLFKLEKDTKTGLFKKVLNVIIKQWPDRDFAFLDGFGSRKKNDN